ncbi:RagB/SusD family nutrient uptake outer membrane protein [Pedobacter faecalis]|uniref:RagB/SusD family nutrient uptake outer membrane protein n=1 Tax=Pedobacter faecalis TaxID=3041495 RepID=UPI00254FFB73|nr:RagB/SusD family nutrient uptake outer membrane protein [Pedobacter sp. ELA7]
MKKINFIYPFILLLGASGCEKAVEVDIPMGKFTNNAVYNTDDLAQAGVRGVYASMVAIFSNTPFQGGLSGNLGLLSDELVRGSYSDDQRVLLENNLSPTLGIVSGLWATYYNYVLQANMVYENAEASTGLSPLVRQSIMGEARLLRALAFFYLTNIYGDVPLTLTSDYTKNALLRVSSPEEVLKQVEADLLYAQQNLVGNSTAPGFRYRPTKWSATALLARVYLYQRNWAAAEEAATTVISQNGIFTLEALDNVFLATSKEAVWALNNAGSNIYTTEAGTVQGQATSNAQFHLSPYMLSKFEATDQRRVKWTKTFGAPATVAPYKFKTYSNTQTGAKAESVMFIRLAELYLIRAEARSMRDNLPGAIADVDAVRVRAGAVANNDGANASNPFKTIGFSNPTIDKEALVELIYDERLRELFAEFGHRWFDAKRSAAGIVAFFGERKPGISATDAYFPVPERERQFNPNIDQRDGY